MKGLGFPKSPHRPFAKSAYVHGAGAVHADALLSPGGGGLSLGGLSGGGAMPMPGAGAPSGPGLGLSNLGQPTTFGSPAHSPAQKKQGRWIQGAVKKPGQLHRDLNVPQGKKIPAGKLAAAAKRPGKVGQRARLAKAFKKMK